MARKDAAQGLNRPAIKYPIAIFGDEDQVDMHCEYTVSTVG
jgi:hypothetical protein